MHHLLDVDRRHALSLQINSKCFQGNKPLIKAANMENEIYN